jgi:hypothetical protein
MQHLSCRRLLICREGRGREQGIAGHFFFFLFLIQGKWWLVVKDYFAAYFPYKKQALLCSNRETIVSAVLSSISASISAGLHFGWLAFRLACVSVGLRFGWLAFRWLT